MQGNGTISALCLIISLILPALSVYPLIWIIFKTNSRLLDFIFSFAMGWAVFSIFLFFAGLLGLPINFISGMIILLFIFLISLLFRRFLGNEYGVGLNMPKENDSRKINFPSIILIVLTGIIFGIILISALSQAVNDMSGHAVWGFKAMAIYKNGGIPLGLFTDSTEKFTHQNYPLGYPLMLSWGYAFMGEINDYLIKLVPVILALIAYLSFYSILRLEGCSKAMTLLFCLLACGNYIFLACATRLYAENLLVLYCVWGLYFLYRHMKEGDRRFLPLGFFFLAAGAWLKNEGLLYLFFAILFIIILDFRGTLKNLKMFLFALLIPLIIFVFPWRMFTCLLNITDSDFSFERPLQLGSMAMFEVLTKSSVKMLSNMFLSVGENCGVWYILLILMVFCFRRIYKDKPVAFLILISISIIVVFAFVFIFSVRPLDWHMRSMQRILLVPSFLAWMAIAFSVKKSSAGSM